MRLVGVICGLLKPPFLSRERRLFYWFDVYEFINAAFVRKGEEKCVQKFLRF